MMTILRTSLVVVVLVIGCSGTEYTYELTEIRRDSTSRMKTYLLETTTPLEGHTKHGELTFRAYDVTMVNEVQHPPVAVFEPPAPKGVAIVLPPLGNDYQIMWPYIAEFLRADYVTLVPSVQVPERQKSVDDFIRVKSTEVRKSLDYAHKRFPSLSTNVVLLGVSFGGILASQLMQELEPDTKISSVTIEAPIFDVGRAWTAVADRFQTAELRAPICCGFEDLVRSCRRHQTDLFVIASTNDPLLTESTSMEMLRGVPPENVLLIDKPFHHLRFGLGSDTIPWNSIHAWVVRQSSQSR